MKISSGHYQLIWKVSHCSKIGKLKKISIDTHVIQPCSSRPVEEGGWSSNFSKLWDSSYFGIPKGYVIRTDLDEKLMEPISWAKIGSKSSKITQILYLANVGRRKLIDHSKWLQEWIYYGLFTVYIPLR